MKYLKLFENWLNEATISPEISKIFMEKLKAKGFTTSDKGGILWANTHMQYEPVAQDVGCSLELNLFDSKNPSNSRLMDGITIIPTMSHGGGGIFESCRWTLNPIDVLTADQTVLQEAKAVREFIKSKFGEYVSKYGFLSVDAGTRYNVCFNGKCSSYWDDGTTSWDVKPMKQSFSKEEIKMMKLNAKQGLKFLENMTKEIEAMGKNLFKFELSISGGLPTSYKLCSSVSKDTTPDRALYAKELNYFIQDVKKGYKDGSPTGAGLNNDLYRAITYAIGKSLFFEILYDKESKMVLDLAAMYGNSDNKYQPKLLAKWGEVSNNMQIALGVAPEEINNYAPNANLKPNAPLKAPSTMKNMKMPNK